MESTLKEQESTANAELKELRKLVITVPAHEPEEGKQPKGSTPPVRMVEIQIVFADGTARSIRTGTSMSPWPTDDLLDTVKGFIFQLQPNPDEEWR